MKVIKSLTGEVGVAADWDTRALQALHHEVAPGCFVFVTLGPAGVCVSNGTDCIGIPLDAIVALAQRHEEKLKPR